MKLIGKGILMFSAVAVFAGSAFATPSTQIWIPSTDIQKKEMFHLGIDDYFTEGGGGRKEGSLATDVGITYGAHENVEVGIDYLGATDDPFYFNFKVGFPETNNMPAFAAGGYLIGTNRDDTDYNIVYVLAAKTVGKAGRFSVGGYTGNDDLLVDEDGDEEESGFLLSWDRTMSEISDKLWVAVDYQSGDNVVGALGIGASWAFADNVSVILGYVIPNDEDAFGLEEVITTQVDINF